MVPTTGRYLDNLINMILRLANDINFKDLAVTGPRKLWARDKVILIGDAAHSMLPSECFKMMPLGATLSRKIDIRAGGVFSFSAPFHLVGKFWLWGRLDQGQCESQAIEDAAALSVFLSYLQDKRDVERRLLGFQKVRRNRASALHLFSNMGQEVTQVQCQGPEEATSYMQSPVPSELRLDA